MNWTHSICVRCWNARNERPAASISVVELENCCFCGEKHGSGIYVRADGSELWCKGTLGIHKEGNDD